MTPNASIYTPIPVALRDAVERAVRDVFQEAEPESLTLLVGGMSGTMLFKLVVARRVYVLRVVQARTALNDPERQFACVAIAAGVDVAPPVYYADAKAGICITGFVEGKPVRPALQADPSLAAHLGELLCRLHGGPAFPVFLDTLQSIQGGLNVLTAAGVSLPDLLRSYLARFEVVRAALGPHLASAPCHNDLNPKNLLFDGTRLWIIDWETACMGDPFFDLATAIHWFVLSPAQEAVLLGAYFGAEPDACQRAKLELMKQVSWCYYALVFWLLALQRGETVAPLMPEDKPLPSFAAAVRAVAAGTMNLESSANGLRFSLIIANEALGAMDRPEFARALATLA
jgi:aminoglycoside phosphotransferase (APT) family kinase protein